MTFGETFVEQRCCRTMRSDPKGSSPSIRVNARSPSATSPRFGIDRLLVHWRMHNSLPGRSFGAKGIISSGNSFGAISESDRSACSSGSRNVIAIRSDRKDDPVDPRPNQIAIASVVICVQRFPQSVANKLFNVGRRHAGDGSRFAFSVLQQGVRHVVAITHALLVGVARAHRIAAIVEEKTDEHGGGT